MNRAERRKTQKLINKKLTNEQFEQLKKEANGDFIEKEVEKRMKYNEELFKEALHEAFKRQNISSAKEKALLDDMILIMRRKRAERNGKLKA